MPELHWLPGGFDHLHLDIVGFLAILGEASIKVNAQVATLAWSTLLPRILPAPQALIRTSRPDSLKPHNGKVIGVHSGGVRDVVNHLAHLIHCRTYLPPYTVRCEQILKVDRDATVSAATWGPLAWLDGFGAAISLSLLVLAIRRSDGFAMLATILLSLLSTVVGFGNQWSLKLMQRTATRKVPNDTIVIKYLNGSFIVVKCDEDIARELYWHPEECDYLIGDTVYRAVSLIGTILLMFGVICLGNSTLPLQTAFAAAYMILNAVYWAVAALPPQWHWDTSCYRVMEEKYQGEETQATFTLALWRVISITEDVQWVKNEQVAPVSKAWNEWIDDADAQIWGWKEDRGNSGLDVMQDQTERPLPEWRAEDALTRLLDPDKAAREL